MGDHADDARDQEEYWQELWFDHVNDNCGAAEECPFCNPHFEPFFAYQQPRQFDKTTKRQRRHVKMITSEVRFSYLNAFEAAATPSGDMKFSAAILIPKHDEVGIKEIQAAILAAVAKGVENNKFTLAHTTAPTFKNPLRDGDAEHEAGNRGPEYRGSHFLNASSKTKPGLVDVDLKPLFDQSEFYSGCYGRADINFFPYNTAGNRGVGVGLNNLMLTREGERLDGRMTAEDAFEAFKNPIEPDPSATESSDDNLA